MRVLTRNARFVMSLCVLMAAMSGQPSRAQTAPQNDAPAAAVATPGAAGETGSSDKPSAMIEIQDEPRAIDPATLMNERLASRATVNFNRVSIKDVFRWLQEEQKLSVSVDNAALKSGGILSNELVSDQLNDEPLHLLLDRLRSIGIGWYEQGGDLFLTTTSASNEQMTTVSYNLGELLDSGFDGDTIVGAISSAIGNNWSDNGDGEGAIVMLGDVIFVRQTQPIQREVRGLLAALKSPARMTLTVDPPQHAALREKLEQKISISLQETPLDEAVAEFARASGADIRLHAAELKQHRIRDRAPVTIELADQKLHLALQSALSELNLTWIVSDGVIWIVHSETGITALRTAVYDVRDLCRDEDESDALMYAVEEQAGGLWSNLNDKGGVVAFAKPGIMVVSQTQQTLDGVRQLLENYRTALRGSKQRTKPGPDPKEILTHYYRLPSAMAEQLESQLKVLVRPETWQGEWQPEAIGTIAMLNSTTDLLNTHGAKAVADGKSAASGEQHVLAVRNSVLIIRQMREVHLEIDSLLLKLNHGDQAERYGNPGGGMGGGGGFGGGGLGGGGQSGSGFGGGFFSTN